MSRSSTSSERHTFISAPIPSTTEDDPDVTPARPPSATMEFIKRNQGLFIIAASQFFFSLMNLSVKILTLLEKPVPTLELVAVRMTITYVCCQIYMFASGVADPILGPKGIRMWLIIRGVVGFFGLFGLYYSLQYLSLSDTTVLTFLSPTSTAVVGYLLLREPYSWRQGAAGVTSLLGVILIAKPTFLFGSVKTDVGVGAGGPVVTEAQRMLAVGVALIGVLGATGAYISIRVIGKRAHPMHTMSYFSLWCVIVSIIGMAAGHTAWVLPTRWTWLGMLLLIGLFGFLAQLLLTIGLQRETASRGALALYVQIVFSLLFERLVFGVVPGALSVVGTCIIMGSAIYVAMNKPDTKSSAPANSESTAMWDLAPAAEEGRGLLDGDERKDEVETDEVAKKPEVRRQEETERR
ncbi:transport protein [Ceratobasidium sp. AG-Ba]|nr:transport protein [Ceratobasidium sp. AG-Ba]